MREGEMSSLSAQFCQPPFIVLSIKNTFQMFWLETWNTWQKRTDSCKFWLWNTTGYSQCKDQVKDCRETRFISLNRVPKLSAICHLHWQTVYIGCCGNASKDLQSRMMTRDLPTPIDVVHLIWKNMHLIIFFLPTFNDCDPTCATSPIRACWAGLEVC